MLCAVDRQVLRHILVLRRRSFAFSLMSGLFSKLSWTELWLLEKEVKDFGDGGPEKGCEALLAQTA